MVATATCNKCDKKVLVKKGKCILCGERIDGSGVSDEGSSAKRLSAAAAPRHVVIAKSANLGKMPLTGGSFGLNGYVYVRDDDLFIENSAGTYSFTGDEIIAVSSSSDTKENFGCFGFVIAAVILSVIFGFFLNIIGVAIAFIIAYFGSKYTTTSLHAEIKVKGDKFVTVKCNRREIETLTSLAA